MNIAKDTNTGICFTIEDFLNGIYQKYTNNAFFINQKLENENDEIMAFSHFSYDFSGGTLMIADL